MELTFLFVTILVILAISINKYGEKTKKPKFNYFYAPKKSIMTDYEKKFLQRLLVIVGDKYFVFPQIHLSSLAISKTKGKYSKLSYQRINRRSVDFLLADKVTLAPVYAVELDDRTHDTVKAQNVDALKTDVLNQIGLPLIRFRNINSMSDEEIVTIFEKAHSEIRSGSIN